MTVNDVSRALPQTVLRAATDRRLLDETIRQGRTTRAELADMTGYSRPTVSEAVRRLVEGGLLDATGLKETGRRGRIGTFYELGARAGWVLAVELDQSGVRARAADLAGRTLDEHRRPAGAPGDVDALVANLRAAVGAFPGGPGPLRAVGISIANPVHPVTHEVVPLAGTPFPEGLLSPAELIGDLVPAPILVDNDVNLAALAEHRAGRAVGEASFAYVYVGAGLGVGLYIGDQLIRGAHGLAGEIGYLPGAGAPTIAADLAAGGLGRSDAPSNDVAAALELLDRGDEPALRVLAAAVARAIISVAAVVDPALVLLGGPVGTHPALLPRVRAAISFPGPTRVEHGTLGTEAALHGALQLALEHARAAAVAV
ncbi:ROK family transcriptional regulator [Actinoplanes auranticolor]|uniref:ROK family transcriptional regulator n=1 Tax=Actinoplanes auranticolor TaxID=47988 RepID=UPI001BB3CC4D|nr:ROK family transcriptional regulator [Actinoplanes auranticolor]